MPLSVLIGERHPGDLWTARDRELAIALTEYEESLCQGCGWPLDVCADPEFKGMWETTVPKRCHACTTISVSSEEYQKTDAKGRPIVRYPQHLRFPVRLTAAGRAALYGGDEHAET